MIEYITAVDINDRVISQVEKMEAHFKGVLHRAFSIFIFNSSKQLLLQKRNKDKYHSGGLWTNTCCGHPRYGETLTDAIHRRLGEEMGVSCELKELFSFLYQVGFENKLIENEYDHIFIGTYNGICCPNFNEVEEYKWVNVNEIKLEMAISPQNYTYWFRCLFDKVIDETF
ncbi:isopentenyl-diphosphate Delta-isomerase [Desulfosporosinus sp. PR]|uniref:isopentenyl-diphosphate Delta-isomerase n=1 Tax=Candidatus Desulfosporosinus nitrosoreducens TaxID=3401928 RepID=UPI0027F23F19|nr:isopentenyl-diphosphate Delta-isomerase [Desulfosporosinus sp. PR]MDQ7092845.1 isopentenyl-diphosphate Delta-isomerase [Desulfosporosinus sp. PR]